MATMQNDNDDSTQDIAPSADKPAPSQPSSEAFGGSWPWLQTIWNGLFGSDPHILKKGPDFFGLRVLLGWMTGYLFVAELFLVFGYAETWSFAATILLWSFGLCAAGTILGFLFAIPRVITEVNSPTLPTVGVTPESAPTAAFSAAVRQNRLAANTNLEQVSDWLTKIIVGVGLIELSEIPGLTTRLAVTMSPSFGSLPLGTSVATGVIVLFTTGGFLIGYVTTRAFLPHILDSSDQQVIEIIRSQQSQARGAQDQPEG
jgi:hypothetical protein